MRNFTLLFSLLCAGTLTAQVTFKTIYGTPVCDESKAIDTTSQNGYAIAGFVAHGTTNMNFQLMTTNAVGDTLWTREYDTGGDDYLMDMKHTADGGYIMAGSDFASPGIDAILIKVNSGGVVSWSGSYSLTGSSEEWVEKVIQTSDGGYAVAGWCYVNSVSNGFLLKTDANGVLQWMKYYAVGSAQSRLTCLTQDANGDIIAGGVSFSTPQATIALRVSMTGTLVWYQLVNGANNSWPTSIVLNSAGEIFLGGTLDRYNPPNERMFMTKLTAAGGWVWTKHYNLWQPMELNSMLMTAAGDICITGQAGFWPYYGVVMMADPLGNVATAINYTDLYAYSYVDVAPGTDGGFAILGMIDSAFGVHDTSSYLLIKTTANLSAQCGVNAYGVTTTALTCSSAATTPVVTTGGISGTPVITTQAGLTIIPVCALVGLQEQEQGAWSVYPNPASDFITVEGESPDGRIILYNTAGAIMRSEQLSSSLNTISLDGLPAGLYFYRVEDAEGVRHSGKIVKQ